MPILVAAVLVLPGCGYGSRTQQGSIEVYYVDGATQAEADALGAFLVKLWNAQSGETRSVQLKKMGTSYQFRMVVKKGFEQDPKLSEELGITASRISHEILSDADVEAHFCNDHFDTLRTIPMRDDMRYSVRQGNVAVYYGKNTRKEDAQRLLDHFGPEVAGAPGAFDFKLEHSAAKIWEIHMVVQKDLEKDPSYLQQRKLAAQQLSRLLFGGEPVEFHLCDEHMRSLQIVQP
jgi:hypothetical protein